MGGFRGQPGWTLAKGPLGQANPGLSVLVAIVGPSAPRLAGGIMGGPVQSPQATCYPHCLKTVTTFSYVLTSGKTRLKP